MVLGWLQSFLDATPARKETDVALGTMPPGAAAMADKVIAAMGGDVKGKTIGVLGLAFKQNTDDMRDSPSLAIIPALQAAGAQIRAYDPEGMDEARRLHEETREHFDGSLADLEDTMLDEFDGVHTAVEEGFDEAFLLDFTLFVIVFWS